MERGEGGECHRFALVGKIVRLSLSCHHLLKVVGRTGRGLEGEKCSGVLRLRLAAIMATRGEEVSTDLHFVLK